MAEEDVVSVDDRRRDEVLADVVPGVERRAARETPIFRPAEERGWGKMSKGMKRQLALTLTVAQRPELLILDEPTSGLDP